MVRKGHLRRFLVTRAHARKMFMQLFQHRARLQHQGHVRAVLDDLRERLVHPAGRVLERHLVADRYRPLHRLPLNGLAAQPLHPFFHLRIFHRSLGFDQRQPRDLRFRKLRIDIEPGLVLHRAVFAVLFHRDPRIDDWLHFFRRQRLAEGIVGQFLHHLTVDLREMALPNHLHRYLAWAKTFDAQSPGKLSETVFDLFDELLLRHRNPQGARRRS